MRTSIPALALVLFLVPVAALAAGGRTLYCVTEKPGVAACTLENGDGGTNDHFEAEFDSPAAGYVLPPEFAFAVRITLDASRMQGRLEPSAGGYGDGLSTIPAPEGSGVVLDPLSAGPMTLRRVSVTVDPALL